MSIININSQDEFVNLIEKNDNCIVDFYAEWCNPCKRVSKELYKITENFPDIKILKVNINKFDNIANTFKVEKIPHFSFFKDNQLHDNYIQTSNIDQIIDLSKKIYE